MTGGRDTAILFAARGGMLVLGLMIQLLLAWTLLPEGRGAYAVCVVFAGLLGLACTPGAHSGAQYFVMTRRISVSQGVSAALAICVAGSAAGAAIAVPLIRGGVPIFEGVETHALYLALVLAPFLTFGGAVEYQLAGLRRFARLAVFVVLRAAANVLLLAALVWALDLGVGGALAAYAASQLLLIAVGLRDLGRHCGLTPEPPARAGLAGVLGYGVRHHVAGLGERFGPRAGVLALGLIATPAEIGLFAVASVPILYLNVISDTVGSVLLPRIAGEAAARAALVALSLRVVLWSTAAALAAALAVCSPLAGLALPAGFAPIVPMLWIMAPGALARAACGIFQTHFVGADRPGVCSWAVWLGLSVNFAALVLLYPELGVRAAAWALTLGMCARCLLLLVLYRRATGTAWSALWAPQRGDPAFLIASVRSVWRRVLGREAAGA